MGWYLLRYPKDYISNCLVLVLAVDRYFLSLLFLTTYMEKYQDLLPIPLLEKSKDDILLFFKLYDPEKEELR